MTRKERIDAVLDELTPYGFTFRTLQMPYIWDINVLNTGQVIRVSGKKN